MHILLWTFLFLILIPLVIAFVAGLLWTAVVITEITCDWLDRKKVEYSFRRH